MRAIGCAHALTAAVSVAVRNHAIRLDGERIASADPATDNPGFEQESTTVASLWARRKLR
jgi:hypothetical protein